MPFANDGFPMPGMDREPHAYRSDHFPTLAGEILVSEAVTRFPFASWATMNRFAYPPAALEFLRACQSAAEAFFVREFARRDGFEAIAGTASARCGPVFVELQKAAGAYRIDVCVTADALKLAIEIDGLGFHRIKAEQVAADYLRQRRIVCHGYTVVRFTAPEVFADPAECWRQVDAILHAHRTRRAR